MEGTSLALAREQAEQRARGAGIGTLREKSLHAVLKHWLEPDAARHEVAMDGYVADIFDGQRITEIQTGSLKALCPKLEALLAAWPVTVVHPVVHRKSLIWVDPADGTASTPHKSPKTGGAWDCLPELYAAMPLLGHPRLTIRVLLLDMDEMRLRDGWDREGKRGSHRIDRLPTAVVGETVLRGPGDLIQLLPPGLPEPFTSRDFGRAAHMHGRRLTAAISLLYKYDIIQRVGKSGNAYLYALAEEDGQPADIS